VKLFSLFFCLSLFCVQAGEFTFPSTQTVQGKKLILNGTGWRKAFLGIKVYHAGLYLTGQSLDGEQIINASEVRQVAMKFSRDVGLEKITSSYKEGLEKNGVDLKTIEADFNKFISLMSDLKEDDLLALTIAPTKVVITINGVDKGTVDSDLLGKSLLRIWLGKNPPSEDLKTGLLGKE
jgi:hypothetical protein